MKIFKNKKGTFGVVVAVLFLIAVVGNGYMFNRGFVSGLSLACSNSQACREAAAKEEAANKAAVEASNSANFYQSQVNALNSEIAAKELEIAETEANVRELQKKIVETEAELQEKRTALAKLLVKMHFESDAEPIVILAGSSSISDLAEKQARSEVIKQQIGAATTRIKEVKLQLEADKAEVEELLARQQQAKKDLEVAVMEQRAMAEKYERNAAAFEAEAKEALAAKLAAELKEQQSNPGLYGYGSVGSGVNTYYWQNVCPEQNLWDFSRYPGVGIIGGYLCQCTSYAGWKVYESYKFVIRAWGNAKSWDETARLEVNRKAGIYVNNTPTPGSVGQSDKGEFGHVFWVESVNPDGSIKISEYNYYYSSIPQRLGDFGVRELTAAEAAQFEYIHFR